MAFTSFCSVPDRTTAWKVDEMPFCCRSLALTQSGSKYHGCWCNISANQRANRRRGWRARNGLNQHARLDGGACVQMFRRLRPARLLVESVDICGSPRRLCCLAAKRKTIVVIILLQLSGLTPRRERRMVHWWTCPRRYSNNMKPQDR